MGYRIELLDSGHLGAIAELNRRLVAGGVTREFLLPERLGATADPGAPVRKDQFVVSSDRGVHGGFMLQQQDFWVDGKVQKIGNYQMPISEGLIDRAHATIGMLMVREALRRCPRVFALGMGGREHRLPRMLQAMGWQLSQVPFFFHVHNPGRFMRNIGPLRSSAPRRILGRVLAASGVGWAGIRLMQARRLRVPHVCLQRVDRFGPWADEVWERSKAGLSFGARRSSEMLNLLYPPENSRFLRFKVVRNADTVAWVVLLDTPMRNNRHFTDLRVGTIADGVAVAGEAASAVRAARAWLGEQGVDLTVSNQSHVDWMRALKGCGFLQGPSNYVFAASSALHAVLEPRGHNHITRGDGEGPLSL